MERKGKNMIDIKLGDLIQVEGTIYEVYESLHGELVYNDWYDSASEPNPIVYDYVENLFDDDEYLQAVYRKDDYGYKCIYKQRTIK